MQEKMFGTGEAFTYFQCGACGCLQIDTIPDDLARYYGNGYYSFKQPAPLRDNPFKAYFKRLRTRCALGGESWLAAGFLKLYPPPHYFHWMQKAGVTPAADILDVGCGSGELLVRLYKDGFRSLTGMDAFVDDDIIYSNGVRILKKTLAAADARYDFIMLHHSFEHMADPLGSAGDIHRALHSARYALIRVPLVASHAWETYGADWVQLDVPRHLYLHTETSMAILAAKAGFEVKSVEYDSDEFQFWGSEQYRQGISLRSPDSLANGFANSMFSRQQIKAYKLKAAELNRQKAGDQACFFLFKPSI